MATDQRCVVCVCVCEFVMCLVCDVWYVWTKLSSRPQVHKKKTKIIARKDQEADLAKEQESECGPQY